jgi:hypothetical protein
MPTDLAINRVEMPSSLTPQRCLVALFLSFICSGCTAPLSTGAAGAGGALGAATGAAPAQPATLWSFLGLSKAQKAACLQEICNNPLLGPASNAMLAPMSLMTGGLFSGLCPPSSAFGQGGSPAQQVASAVAADEASAKERVAAVEYLATVDCHYWPDVEEAIIASLRADKNECVRYAAAKALISGCCCGKKTIEALTIVVNRSDKDGNPSENSDRVVAAACTALQRCLAVYCDEKPLTPEELPEALPEEPAGREPATATTDTNSGNGFATELARLPGPLPADVTKKAVDPASLAIPPKIRAYYRVKLASKPREDVIIESFQTLRLAVATKYWLGTSTMPPGSQSVASIVEKAATIAPTGIKPLTRNQVLNSPDPFPAATQPDYYPPLPPLESPVLQDMPVEIEPKPVEPRTVKIPKATIEPIILSNPSSSVNRSPAP